jgi:hypothetical protein
MHYHFESKLTGHKETKTSENQKSEDHFMPSDFLTLGIIDDNILWINKKFGTQNVDPLRSACYP